MSAALNHEAFDNALERFHHGRKAGEGMWAISKVHLRPGQFYYRFVDADRVAPPQWADGPWWVDYENYLRIRRLAEAGGSTLSDYAQVNGAQGGFQHRFAVYDRESEPCLTKDCGGTIVRAAHGGRSSFWCPRCQR